MKKSLNRKSMLVAMLSVLAFGLCMVCPWIQASAAETRSDTSSSGSIIYENGADSVAIYTEDISLLKEALNGVRAEVYDPASYGHVHQWEYANITENTHTEQCAQCGTSDALVNAHAKASSEKCVIAYDGQDYPGYRYLCACGFEWLQERYHTPVYTPIDAFSHTVSCALHGTAYCDGLGEIDGEHTSILQPTDRNHHRASCEYCKYEGTEQACVFEKEGSLDEDGITQKLWYCECGNYTIEAKDPTAPPEEETETEANHPTPPKEEETPGTPTDESGQETPDAPADGSEQETPDTPTDGSEQETPDTPTNGSEQEPPDMPVDELKEEPEVEIPDPEE